MQNVHTCGKVIRNLWPIYPLIPIEFASAYLVLPGQKVVLDTKKTPPTYKAKPVDAGYSLDEKDAHWTITLEHEKQSCNFDFKEGVYDGKKVVNGQKLDVSNCAGTAGGQNDAWSAESVPPGLDPDAPQYRK